MGALRAVKPPAASNLLGWACWVGKLSRSSRKPLKEKAAAALKVQVCPTEGHSDLLFWQMGHAVALNLLCVGFALTCRQL